jgi:hypothetical protein
VPISPFANRTLLHKSPRSRSLTTGLVVVALVGVSLVAGWLGLQFRVQNQLRSTLQAKLNALLQQSQLSGEILKAEFIPEEGIRLYDVSFNLNGAAAQAASSTPLVGVEIYEAFVELPVSMPELLATALSPNGIQIRRAKIRLQQSELGDWNIGQLIQQISRLPTPKCKRIPLDFRDCSIELVSENPQSPTLTLSDVALSIRPVQQQGRLLTQIQGEFNGRDVTGTQFSVLLDEQQRTWHASFNVPKCRISANLLTLLPQQLRQQFSVWPQIEGVVAGQGIAAGDFSFNSPTQFSCNGTLESFSCEDPKLPIPIRQASLNFSISNQGVSIREAQGKLGEGEFNFDLTQDGLGHNPAWRIKGGLTRFNFDLVERFLPWLPESIQILNQKFNPGGIVDLEFELGDGPNGRFRDLRANLIKASFNMQAFPYLVENCTGTATWIDDAVELHFRSSNGSHTIQIDGDLHRPGPQATFSFDISVPHGLPLDEKLQSAMSVKPQLKKIIDDFNPTGKFSLLGRIEKNTPDGRLIHAYDIRLQECTIKHNRFDYPIYNLEGLVQVRDQAYAFVDISGSSNGASVTANGSFTPAEGLDVKFLCRSVPLDKQLKGALSASLKKIWTGFRPSGTLDLARVRLLKDNANTPIAVTLEASLNKPVPGAEPSAVSIKPVWFPYEIQQLSGNVKIGQGKIEITEMTGQHGRTWLACVGEGEYGAENWWLNLKNLLVGSLKVDEDLLAAVPKSVTPSLRKLAYEGLLNVHGEVTLAGKQLAGEYDSVETSFKDPVGGSGSSMAWDLGFDMNQAKMKVGLPIENVFGSVQLKGEYDGRVMECLGELAIDSMTIKEMQITEVTGPIRLDGQRAAAGMFVATQSPNSSTQNFSPVAGPSEAVRSITGKMYGGLVKLDAQINADPTGEFYIQTTLADACLNELCRDKAAKFSDVKGRIFSALGLTGNSLGTHSFRGEGRVQLRQAEIFELPLMLAVLKSMHVGTKNQTAFDESNVDFRISGEEIDFTRIEMLGSPVSLLGNGKANFDREIDLNFYSIMGKNRFEIPILSDLYKASSQQVLWINVDGTMDNPQTHRNVLPQINDSLKQLFPSIDTLNTSTRQ